ECPARPDPHHSGSPRPHPPARRSAKPREATAGPSGCGATALDRHSGWPCSAPRHALRKRKKTARKSARPKNGIEISEHRKLEACVPFFLKPHISFVKPLIRRREARRLRMICAHAQGRNPKVASRFRMSALILFLILPPFLPNFPSHNWIMLKIRDKPR